nr:IS3 family transposase [Paenibacillus curdlanolyticus]
MDRQGDVQDTCCQRIRLLSQLKTYAQTGASATSSGQNKAIIEEHEDNRNYGVQRILLALSQREITTSYSTVYRIMKQHGLLKKAKRHPNGITREDAEAQKSENLIQRDFTASAANQKWHRISPKSLVQTASSIFLQ